MSRTFHHGDRAKQKKFGTNWHWMSNEPKWWRKIMFTRPRRSQTRAAMNEVLSSISMEDDTKFPLDKKPHNYYW